MSSDMEALATRLEQAGPESQAELLRMVWAAIMPSMAEPYTRFNAMLDCGAYESAAMMFVPAHLRVCAISQSPDVTEWYAKLAFIGRPGGHPASGSSSAALALAAACVRASIAGKEGA